MRCVGIRCVSRAVRGAAAFVSLICSIYINQLFPCPHINSPLFTNNNIASLCGKKQHSFNSLVCLSMMIDMFNQCFFFVSLVSHKFANIYCGFCSAAKGLLFFAVWWGRETQCMSLFSAFVVDKIRENTCLYSEERNKLFFQINYWPCFEFCIDENRARISK